MRTKFPKQMLQEVADATTTEHGDAIVVPLLNRAGRKRSPHFWEGVPASATTGALEEIRRLQRQRQLGEEAA